MEEEEEEFSEHETSSLSSLSDRYEQLKLTPPIIESNLIYEHPPRRQMDHLYENICQKNLQPREWLLRVKSDKSLPHKQRSNMEMTPKAMQLKQTIQKSNKSFQDEIVLSNYKQLLRNQFQTHLTKDQQLHDLRKRYLQQERQSKKIRDQNLQLKREMAKIKKGEHEREEKVKELDSNLKKLSRKYENLLKQSETRESGFKWQIKKLREEKSDYENLAEALKESIHILKGKKVKDLSQIWQQWKQIFELASLQKCKLTKKAGKP